MKKIKKIKDSKHKTKDQYEVKFKLKIFKNHSPKMKSNKDTRRE